MPVGWFIEWTGCERLVSTWKVSMRVLMYECRWLCSYQQQQKQQHVACWCCLGVCEGLSLAHDCECDDVLMCLSCESDAQQALTECPNERRPSVSVSATCRDDYDRHVRLVDDEVIVDDVSCLVVDVCSMIPAQCE